MGIPESAEPSRNLAQFVAFVALAVGLFVLAGWAFDMEQLTNIVPTWPRMVKLTALSFILSGFALWLATIRTRGAGHHRRRAADRDRPAGAVSNTPPAGTSTSTSSRSRRCRRSSTETRRRAWRRPPALAFLLLGASLLFAQQPRGALLHQALAIVGHAARLARPVALHVRRRAAVRVHEHGGAHRDSCSCC